MAFSQLLYFEENNIHGLLDCLQPSQRDIYYTAEYNLIYQHNGDGRAACFVYEDMGELILYPFLINPIRPLGYSLEKEYYDIQGAYGYNGAITSSSSPTFVAGFHREFDSFCKKNDIIAEFTRFHPLLNNYHLASPQMKLIHSRHTVSLDLSLAEDEIWKNQISSKNRNMIRKAEKEGVTIVESDDYETFKMLYDRTMMALHAEDFYFFPQAYYDEYRRSFERKSMLCMAMYEGKPIAASMFMFSDGYAHYHLSARDRCYSRLAANNLILWYAIRKAKERGCSWFHFGGGTTGNEDDSLLKFKKEFSKTETDFWIGKRVHNQDIYDEIVRQWKTRYPERYENNKVKLLGYREI